MSQASKEFGLRALFAERLALLFAEAGNPPLKQVAATVARLQRTDDEGRPLRVSVQRVSDWRRGRNVPSRFAALSVVLEILIGEARKVRTRPVVEDLYDLEAWRSLWEEALNSPVAGSSDCDSPDAPLTLAGEADANSLGEICPYPGLASFRQEDSKWFFGREHAIGSLTKQIRTVVEAGGIITLVGASGAGKSSLLNAGLVSALSTGELEVEGSADWPVIVMVPGSDPLEALACHIPGLADARTPGGPVVAASVRAAVTAHAEEAAGPGARLILVVDQFEEVFTLCGDQGTRRVFIEALHTAATPGPAGSCPAPAVVVLGLRADFYSRFLDYPELAEALQDHQMVLGPMTMTELRQAIEDPAKAAGVRLEKGLADLLIEDFCGGGNTSASGGDAYDAGALPLLSHALSATWQRRRNGRVSTSDYRKSGGIQGAVIATAESAWSRLGPGAREAGQSLLLRLVRVAEDGHDTRRRAGRDELIANATDPEAAHEALEELRRARLVTLEAGSVQIAHETLLRAWPRLRQWIDQDREGNVTRQRLEEDARNWEAGERDPSLLYRGASLENAQRWADTAASARPSRMAAEFLRRSVRQQQRALRLRRGSIAAVLVLAVIAAASAVVAIRERDDAVYRQLVSEADSMRDADPSLAARLYLVARRMRPDDANVRTRILSTVNTPLSMPLAGHTGAVYLTSFSPDGRTLATASADHTARLWDLRDPRHPTRLGPLTGHTGWLSSAVFSPDGRTLASAGDDATIRLWDVTDPKRPTLYGPPLAERRGSIYLIAFSPDGRFIAAANDDHTVGLWDVHDRTTPVRLGTPLTGHTAAVRSLAWRPDGKALASTGDDGTIRLWDSAEPAHPVNIEQPVSAHDGTVHSVAFSPDGRTLATAGVDKTIRLWDTSELTDPKPLGGPLVGHDGPVWSVKFSSDGLLLASASADGTARLWNLADRSRAQPFGTPLAAQTGTVYAVEFGPDGRTLVTGNEDSTIRLWVLPSTVLLGHTSSVYAPVFSPDGRLMATGSKDSTVRLWNVADPAHPSAVGGPLTGHSGYVGSMAYGPGGHILATASGDRTVRLWNVSDPAHALLLGRPLTVGTRYVSLVAISPDGRTLATGADDKSIQLWDVTDPARPVVHGPPLSRDPGYVNSLAFSSRGHLLATGLSDGIVRLWNVADPAHPVPIEKRLTGHTSSVRKVVFAPDGRVLASVGDDRTVRLWNVADPVRPSALGRPLIGHLTSVTSVAFSADGSMLATISDDKTFRLWDIRNPSPATPIGQPVAVPAGSKYSVAFHPRWLILATGGGDNAVRLWNLENERSAIQRICATTRNVLTPRQWRLHIPRLSYEPACDEVGPGR